MIQGEVIGIKEVGKMIAGMDDHIKRNVLGHALKSGAMPMLSAMRAAVKISARGSSGNRLSSRNHPAGTLRRSIQIMMSAEGGQYPTVWVKPVKGKGDPDGWYAKFLEYGHFTRKGSFGASGRIKKSERVEFVRPRPFIRPTYDALSGKVGVIITREIMNGVEKYVKQ